MGNKSFRCLLKLNAVIALGFGLNGCASSEKVQDTQTLSHALEVGATMTNPYPLPKETEIYLVETNPDAEVKKSLRYRGWDFDNDDHFDMIEVLSPKGVSQAYVFDFDRDGKVDLVRKIRP
jgi:ribosomal protein S10